jgi:hypothetical protein
VVLHRVVDEQADHTEPVAVIADRYGHHKGKRNSAPSIVMLFVVIAWMDSMLRQLSQSSAPVMNFAEQIGCGHQGRMGIS